MIPPALRRMAAQPAEDVLLVCPGLVYRRDSIDRLHTGEPHQLDLWRLARSQQLAGSDLQHMIALVVRALLPDREYRTLPARVGPKHQTRKCSPTKCRPTGGWRSRSAWHGLAGENDHATATGSRGASTAFSCCAKTSTTSHCCARATRASRVRCST
jgi:hypothetical protein